MVGRAQYLTVVMSPESLAVLADIWDWNCKTYGPDHADEYISFLRDATDRLCTEYLTAKAIPSIPHLSFRTITRRKRQHGHVVVFEVLNDRILIAKYFHTSQDWQRKLADNS